MYVCIYVYMHIYACVSIGQVQAPAQRSQAATPNDASDYVQSASAHAHLYVGECVRGGGGWVGGSGVDAPIIFCFLIFLLLPWIVEWERFPELSTHWSEQYEVLDELLARLDSNLQAGLNQVRMRVCVCARHVVGSSSLAGLLP